MKPDLAQSVNAMLDHLSDELAKTQAAIVATAQVVIEAAADSVGVDLSEFPAILIKCDEAEKAGARQHENLLDVIAKVREVAHAEALRNSWTQPAGEPWVR